MVFATFHAFAPRLIRIVTRLTTLCLAACTVIPREEPLVLTYKDFGPQAMAYRLLGPNKLPWDPETPMIIGLSEVRVVVYQDLELDTVRALYPADRVRNIDYRYVDYASAIDYLNTQIERGLLAKVTERLADTRQRIRRAFEEPSA